MGQGKKQLCGNGWELDVLCQLRISKLCMYMCPCVYICVSVCISVYTFFYYLVLSAERTKKQRCPSSSSNEYSVQIFATKWNRYYSEKWMIPRWGQGRWEMSLEHVVKPEGKEVHRKKYQSRLQGLRRQLQGIPMGQIGYNLNTRIFSMMTNYWKTGPHQSISMIVKDT